MPRLREFDDFDTQIQVEEAWLDRFEDLTTESDGEKTPEMDEDDA